LEQSGRLIEFECGVAGWYLAIGLPNNLFSVGGSFGLSVTGAVPKVDRDGPLYHLIFNPFAGTFALFQTAAQGDK
jgi:hypothetical protein